MSRLARKPILVSDGISVSLNDKLLHITKGSDVKEYAVPDVIDVVVENNSIQFTTSDKSKASSALLGTTHVNVANTIIGLEKGFTIELQLVGIGYGVVAEGNELVLTLGKSHLDRYTIPSDVTITIPDKTSLVIFSQNKNTVGDVADEIVRFRPPDAYKGKGIRYKNRQYKLKEVKK